MSCFWRVNARVACCTCEQVFQQFSGAGSAFAGCPAAFRCRDGGGGRRAHVFGAAGRAPWSWLRLIACDYVHLVLPSLLCSLGSFCFVMFQHHVSLPGFSGGCRKHDHSCGFLRRPPFPHTVSPVGLLVLPMPATTNPKRRSGRGFFVPCSSFHVSSMHA